MKTSVMAVLLAALFAPALMANVLVGKDAPSFDAAGSINAPQVTSFEQMRGDVILIYHWGIN
jgi:hypothetical protein